MATFFVLFDLGVAAGSFLLGMLATNVGYSSVYLACSFIVFLSIGLYFLLHGWFSDKGGIEYNVVLISVALGIMLTGPGDL